MASFVLVIKAPDGSTQSRELNAPKISLGREQGDLVVPDPGCSSRHAELTFDGSSVRIRDLGSTHGTWCNGQMITDISWNVGMTIQIGQHHLTLQEVKQPPQAVVTGFPLAAVGGHLDAL